MMKYLYLFGSLLSLAVFSSSGAEKSVPSAVSPLSDKSNPSAPSSADTKALPPPPPATGGAETARNTRAPLEFSGSNEREKAGSYENHKGGSDGAPENIPTPAGLTWTEKGIYAGAAGGAVLAFTAPSGDWLIGAVGGALVAGFAGHVADMCGYFFRERKRKKLYPEIFDNK